MGCVTGRASTTMWTRAKCWAAYGWTTSPSVAKCKTWVVIWRPTPRNIPSKRWVAVPGHHDKQVGFVCRFSWRTLTRSSRMPETISCRRSRDYVSTLLSLFCRDVAVARCPDVRADSEDQWNIFETSLAFICSFVPYPCLEWLSLRSRVAHEGHRLVLPGFEFSHRSRSIAV